MPDVEEIIERMATGMRGVATAGAVHPRLRSLEPSKPGFPSRLAALIKSPYRGWAIDYLLSTERVGTSSTGESLEVGQIERALRFHFYWTLPFNDKEGSTAAHRRMFEDMAAHFRRRSVRSFGFDATLVQNQLLQGREPGDPVQLSEAEGSLHIGEARMDVLAIVTVTECS